ncbi:MAG: hypothetical protein KAR06_01300 [Deltaproteobacteria bacterium]|nr:hypothetical protein [Deltaproteobacteria bacterium]
MKAKLKEQPVMNRENPLKNVMGKMECIRSYHLIVTKSTNNAPHELIRVRVHGGRSKSAQRIYASVLITDICDFQTKGYGRDIIGITSAVAEALKDAGVELSENLALLDPCMVAHALMAVAEALGHNEYLIIED